MSTLPLPQLGKYYQALLNEMWSSQIINEEDYQNIAELLLVISQPVGDVQEEFRRGAMYLAKVGHYYRQMRRLREQAEEDLDSLFYNYYDSVRTEKFGDEARTEAELPMPVLKNLQKNKKNEAPRGHFSKDLVKCYALKDQSYRQHAEYAIRLRFFEGEFEEIRSAFAQRQSDIAQWSNNNRQLSRVTGE